MKSSTDSNPVYHEEQRFRQPWVWGILLLGVLIMAFSCVSNARRLVQDLAGGEPSTGETASSTLTVVLALSFFLEVLIIVGLLWLFIAAKLVTEVRADGLLVHFYPLRRRWITYAEIQSCQARRYKPLLEYGGWGIRWSGRGNWAYNVSGNEGVHLELESGQRLLIGSQRADELAEAIQARLPDAERRE